MRFLMKVSMQTEAGNKSVINGTLGDKINHMLGELNPEAAYFITKCGKRTALIFLDISEVHLLSNWPSHSFWPLTRKWTSIRL